MRSRRPPYAAQGRPPPITLPRHVRSGPDAVADLRPAPGDAEAGHHLVEQQQRPVLVAQLAQALQVPLGRRDDAHVPRDGLDDEAGDLPRVLLEHRTCIGEVVVMDDHGVPRHRPRHAGAARRPERQRPAAGRDEQPVDVAVVAPDALDDEVAPGGGAGEADGAHRRLGPAVDEPHHLDRRQGRARSPARAASRPRSATRSSSPGRSPSTAPRPPARSRARRSAARSCRRSRCTRCRPRRG